MFIDLSDVEEVNFEPAPTGVYKVVIEEAYEQEYAQREGSYLKVVFLITSGEYENYKIYSNYNIWHESERASKIALGQLKSLCRAVGMPDGIQEDPSELIDAELYIKVKLVKKDENENHQIQKCVSIEEYAELLKKAKENGTSVKSGSAKAQTRTVSKPAARNASTARKAPPARRQQPEIQQAPELEEIPF